MNFPYLVHRLQPARRLGVLLFLIPSLGTAQDAEPHDLNNPHAEEHQLVYMIDGDEYRGYTLPVGAPIPHEAMPQKEGHTFSGWSPLPSHMPAHDVEVHGSYQANTYYIIYRIDGQHYHTAAVDYGADIHLPQPPEKDGYTFSGWSGYPENLTMSDSDLIVHGSYEVHMANR